MHLTDLHYLSLAISCCFHTHLHGCGVGCSTDPSGAPVASCAMRHLARHSPAGPNALSTQPTRVYLVPAHHLVPSPNSSPPPPSPPNLCPHFRQTAMPHHIERTGPHHSAQPSPGHSNTQASAVLLLPIPPRTTAGTCCAKLSVQDFLRETHGPNRKWMMVLYIMAT